jgi:hypothetical protein
LIYGNAYTHGHTLVTCCLAEEIVVTNLPFARTRFNEFSRRWAWAKIDRGPKTSNFFNGSHVRTVEQSKTMLHCGVRVCRRSSPTVAADPCREGNVVRKLWMSSSTTTEFSAFSSISVKHVEQFQTMLKCEVKEYRSVPTDGSP